MAKSVILVLGVVLFVAFSAGPAFGQVTTGAISGTVKDSTDAVLPGSTVTVKNLETGSERTVLTDDAGQYRVSNLAIGSYEISASLEGFQTAVRSGITLTIGRAAVVNFTLNVGEVSEKVTVTGEAPLVETASGGLGDIVDHRTVLELPLNGRDLTDLLTLQSGTANASSRTTGTSQGFSQKVSISGARPQDNAVLLDGTEVRAMDQGVPAGMSGSFMGAEGIQEFKIERNSYSAEFGGASGGVINVVSKSGSNTFHGSVYEFLRNDNLDAANFRDAPILDASRRFVGKAKPEFKRNQFGFSLGGPVIRNKLFFFGNYEGLRERLGFTDFLQTLTPATRQGQLQDARTGQFRTVPINPAVVPYLQLWPLPGPVAIDQRDGTAREPIDLKQPTDEDFYQIRVDQQLSSADSFFVRVSRQTSERFRPEPITRWGHRNFVYNTFVTLEEKKIFSASLLNTFRFGFNRRGIGEESTEDPPTDASLHFVPRSAWRFPLGAPPISGRLAVSGGLSAPGLARGWVDRKVNRFQYSDDLVYTRGAHSLKFGLNWQRIQLNGDNPSRPAGEYSFGSIEDFLRGRPNQFRGDIAPGTDSVRGLRWNVIGWYVQNDWRVGPRLTLNLGFRHEFFTVPTEVNGKIANLRNPLVDTEIATGDPWFENPSLKSFMPRLGLAYDPTGSGKTAIRAGFGMFYNHFQPEEVRQAAFRTAPFALEHNIRGVGRVPFPGIFDFVVQQGQGQADLHLFPFDYGRNPHTLQWNLNVQREIFTQTALTVGYAGLRGLNLMHQVSLNTAKADVVNGRYVFPAGARVPNPFWSLELTSREMSGDSFYHGLQVGLQRRFQAGWQLQLSYTFSKVIDESSQSNPTFANEGGGVVYYHDPDMRRSLAAFDVRQVFVGSAVWELPFGQGRRFASSWPGWMEQILGGWQAGGILSLADGPPTTISMQSRNDLDLLGLAGETPDLVSGASINPVLGNPDRYFDAQGFVLPPARTIGTLGRNTLIGPGLANFDFSLSKNTAIGEAVNVQFRAEFFNLLNRANLDLPASQVLDRQGRARGNAGFISATTTTARQIQFGLRIVF
ncbi:MAG: TonB-dependent receptor [Acidobacteria bacterium]|nr:TonB-dependent receptor [Acidobacteriota bacterium]